MAKYILKNKDIDILSFESVTTQKRGEYGVDIKQTLQNITILNADLLPITLILNRAGKSNEDILLDWVKRRKAPNNRQFIEKIIHTYSDEGNEMPMDYIDISLGLSLNDSLWIVLEKDNYKWKDYNLYDNAFNKTIERIAFGEPSQRMKGITSSPEYTTNGMLPKCWHRENGEICLYKGSSTEYANMGKEMYGEYYMSQVADIMGLEHISYDLKEFHGKIISSCPIFTSKDEGYVDISYFLSEDIIEKIGNKRENYKNEIVKAIIEVYGKVEFENLMVFDALIYNTDRHCGNFGMIVDNNTNKILRPAPIFDNGLSIFNHPTKDDLININQRMKGYDTYLKYSFDEQLKIFVQARHIPNLRKLAQFKFIKHPKFNLSDEWIKPIQAHIQERANLAIKLCKERFIGNLEIFNKQKSILLPQARENKQKELVKECESLKKQGIEFSDKEKNAINSFHNTQGLGR